MSALRTITSLMQGLLVLMALVVIGATNTHASDTPRAAVVAENASIRALTELSGLHEHEADDVQRAIAALVDDQNDDDVSPDPAAFHSVFSFVPRDVRVSDLRGHIGCATAWLDPSQPATGPPSA